MHDLRQHCKRSCHHAYCVTSCASCGVSAPPCALCRDSQVGSGYYSDTTNSIGALQIWPEHRYYATQHPFKPSDSTFVYLNIEQALVDQIEVVLHTQQTLGLSQSPVIAIGSSYSESSFQKHVLQGQCSDLVVCCWCNVPSQPYAPVYCHFHASRLSVHCSVKV